LAAKALLLGQIIGQVMTKRAVDLTLEELAALGGKAARQAVSKAQQRGLTVTGTVDFFNGEQSISSLAQLLPSGTVTLVEKGANEPSTQRAVIKPARRPRHD
jgi:hypothetical protein